LNGEDASSGSEELGLREQDEGQPKKAEHAFSAECSPNPHLRIIENLRFHDF